MIDLMFRGAAIGTMIAFCALLLGDPAGRKRARSTTVFVVLISCYLIISAPSHTELPDQLRMILIAGAVLAPVGFTWMMIDLLTDPPFRNWSLLGLAALSVVAWLMSLLWPPAIHLRGVLVIVLYIALIWLAARSDQDDLVPARRRLRRGFLMTMALLGLIISAVELRWGDASLPAFIYPLQAATFWVLALLFANLALHPNRTLFRDPDIAPPLRSTQTANPLIPRLEAAMHQGIWQREGLTIGALADELKTPEHQLRTTINGDLGYRNFSTYINGHRITAAQAMLRAPENTNKAILEIAYDCGFASLGPFNRAFRAQTGQSPREYRAKS